MGNAVATTKPTVASPTGDATVSVPNSRAKPMRERIRYGVCTVKIAPMTNGQRRPSERLNTYVVTPKGAIIHGTQCNASLIQRAITNSGYPVNPPTEIPLSDSRAHKLLVVYSGGWHAVPSPEAFSRHSGTCVVLGDRTSVSPPYKIKLGDCFRLGSVGLVVSEMRIKDGEEQRLDAKTLQYLKDDSLTIEASDELATLAVDEGDHYRDENGNIIESYEKDNDPPIDDDSILDTNSVKSVDPNSGGIGNGEKFICYMCYETHDTPEDPLVAPCECRGDTRYLHVQCLQKWYQSSVCGPSAQVIRTTGNGAPACKICGTAYKTAFKRADGKRANLLELETSRPYISLVVVTRHDTNASLFNTKFRLNFGRLNPAGNDNINDYLDNGNELSIGRSSSCNMVLDYRTVSTTHAKITYENGGFYLQDKKSSNGTMMYLQEPFPLSFAQPCRLRMGRTTITLQPKRSVTASMREVLTRRRNQDESGGSFLTPQQFQSLMANSGSGGPTMSPSTSPTPNNTMHNLLLPGSPNHNLSPQTPALYESTPTMTPYRPTITRIQQSQESGSGGGGGGGGGEITSTLFLNANIDGLSNNTSAIHSSLEGGSSRQLFRYDSRNMMQSTIHVDDSTITTNNNDLHHAYDTTSINNSARNSMKSNPPTVHISTRNDLNKDISHSTSTDANDLSAGITATAVSTTTNAITTTTRSSLDIQRVDTTQNTMKLLYEEASYNPEFQELLPQALKTGTNTGTNKGISTNVHSEKYRETVYEDRSTLPHEEVPQYLPQVMTNTSTSMIYPMDNEDIHLPMKTPAASVFTNTRNSFTNSSPSSPTAASTSAAVSTSVTSGANQSTHGNAVSTRSNTSMKDIKLHTTDETNM